jgi:SAM-dependent methyltransferase
MDKVERQKQHFDEIALEYYEGRTDPKHELIKNLTWNFFFKHTPFLKIDGLHVLEPMCGFAEGKFIIENNLGIQIDYEGFDYSPKIVKEVNKLYPSLNVYEHDVTKFKCSKTFDLIMITGGLHHVPDFAFDVVRNLTECLDYNGYFVISEPTNNNWVFRKIRERIYRNNRIFDAETERAFSLKEYNDLFLKNGYKIILQIYPSLLAYVLYYNTYAFPLLNIGSVNLVRRIFSVDKRFFKNIIGKKLSWSTISLFQKTNQE